MDATAATALPDAVDRVLTGFVEQARLAFDSDLRSVVLYGSGAEGRLRPTSDLNVILVLSAFDSSKAERLREPMRVAQAAANLSAMFVLDAELQPALEAFAVKFADIIRRRRVLHGEDPFDGLSVARDDEIAQLRQSLLNLTLRMREAYVARGLREEQLTAVIGDCAGPLRACAAALVELEGGNVASPREALLQLARDMSDESQAAEAIAKISEARQQRRLDPGEAAPTLFQLISLSRAMWTRANALN